MVRLGAKSMDVLADLGPATKFESTSDRSRDRPHVPLIDPGSNPKSTHVRPQIDHRSAPDPPQIDHRTAQNERKATTGTRTIRAQHR